jgi:hypothetical protein
MPLKTFRALFASLLVALAAGACATHGAGASADVPPHVELVLGKPLLNLGQYDLGSLGYVEQEYFMSGEAASYRAIGEEGADGRWQAAPTASAPYETRLVVVRPTDPARFNGKVLVEWLNVSGAGDSAPEWASMHRELLRAGFAYVGVSAQKAGIEGNGGPLQLGSGPLKAADLARYGALSHPGDAYAFDIFSQAARAVRAGDGAGVLGPLHAQRVLAAGESQSSGMLTTYVNAIDRLARVYDGYLIHSRSNTVPLVDGAYASADPLTLPHNVRIRTDVRVPVLTVVTELDLTDYYGARQPDTDRIRTWELPGGAHVDAYMLFTANVDSGTEGIDALAAASVPPSRIGRTQLALPINAAPQHHYVMNAALRSLARWSAQGVPPPAAPAIDVLPAPPGSDKDFLGEPNTIVIQRDANGNALGGIRTPWLDVPVATYSGMGNSGGTIAALAGSTVAFDVAQLHTLYPGGVREYLAAFARHLDEVVARGFIVRDDVDEILGVARVDFLNAWQD